VYNPGNPHISIESRPVLRENKPDNGPKLCTLNRCLSTTQVFHSLRPHLLSSSDWHLRSCEKPLRREVSLLRFRIATGHKLNRSGCPPSLSGCPQGCLPRAVSPRSSAIPVYASGWCQVLYRLLHRYVHVSALDLSVTLTFNLIAHVEHLDRWNDYQWYLEDAQDEGLMLRSSRSGASYTRHSGFWPRVWEEKRMARPGIEPGTP